MTRFLVTSSAPHHLPVCEWPEEFSGKWFMPCGPAAVPALVGWGTPRPGEALTLFYQWWRSAQGFHGSGPVRLFFSCSSVLWGCRVRVCPPSGAVPVLLGWPDSQLSVGNFPSLRLHPAQFSRVGEVLPQANPYSGLFFERTVPAFAVNSVFLAVKPKKYCMRNN